MKKISEERLRDLLEIEKQVNSKTSDSVDNYLDCNDEFQIILDAIKKWILSGKKNLDEPYISRGKDCFTLRDILKDIEEQNKRAKEWAKIMSNLVCEMFIKPKKLIDDIKNECYVKAINAYKVSDGNLEKFINILKK